MAAPKVKLLRFVGRTITVAIAPAGLAIGFLLFPNRLGSVLLFGCVFLFLAGTLGQLLVEMSEDLAADPPRLFGKNFIYTMAGLGKFLQRRAVPLGVGTAIVCLFNQLGFVNSAIFGFLVALFSYLVGVALVHLGGFWLVVADSDVWPGGAVNRVVPPWTGARFLRHYLTRTPMVVNLVAVCGSVLLFRAFATWREPGTDPVRSHPWIVLGLLVVSGRLSGALLSRNRDKGRKSFQACLFRRYGDQGAFAARMYLIPAVSTYGGFALATDDHLMHYYQRGDPMTYATGFGEGEVRITDPEWRASVEKMIGEANVALIDVTDFSQNVAWEIARCIELLGPERTILVGDPIYLLRNEGGFFERLEAAVAQSLSSSEPSGSLVLAGPPIPYGTFPTSVLFSYRLFCRLILVGAA